jgi:hypothetical protein
MVHGIVRRRCTGGNRTEPAIATRVLRECINPIATGGRSNVRMADSFGAQLTLLANAISGAGSKP